MSVKQNKTIIINRRNNVSTSTNKNEFRVAFPSPIEFKGAEIALSSAFLWYSWFNIRAQFNNNSFSYKWTDNTDHVVTLPDGLYEVSDIESYLHAEMLANGHVLYNDLGVAQYYINLDINQVYYTITLTCTTIPTSLPTDWTNPNSITLNGNAPCLIIPSTNIVDLMGFNAGMYPPTLDDAFYNINAQNVPNIPRSNVVNIAASNMVNNSSFSTLTDVIYSFSPSVSFSQQIVIQKDTPMYFPIIDGRYSELVIRLIDEEARPIIVEDPNIVITVLLRI